MEPKKKAIPLLMDMCLLNAFSFNIETGLNNLKLNLHCQMSPGGMFKLTKFPRLQRAPLYSEITVLVSRR